MSASGESPFTAELHPAGTQEPTQDGDDRGPYDPGNSFLEGAPSEVVHS